ncbi:MAG TPA: tetratricopeptide repeat protein, partial [Campylobacterales bacterium]|nr:tetratricopeptide repeat protein [Campylobacterales bacterium]
MIYNNKGELDKALEYYEKALKIRLASIGENHPDTANSYQNIGVVYNDKGELSKALEQYEKALKIRLASLGENHPDTASSYNNIGVVYSDKVELDKALECHEKALKIRLASIGENHPDTASSYNNIGVVYYNQSRRKDAMACFEKAFEIVVKTSSGITSPDCERYHDNLAGSTFFVNHENSNINIKIQKAEIENFKLLSKITIELSKNVNIIIGENSSGKTSLLQAITLGLLRKSDLLDHENCVTKNKNEANIKLTIDKYTKVVKIEKGDREVVSNKVLTPFVLAYGSNIFNGDTSAKNIDEYIENIKNKTMTKGFTGSIFASFSTEFYNPKTILNALWADENTKDIAQTVADIINRFIENNGLKIENEKGKFYFKHNGQHLFKLDELSEGYRNSVVLLGDILFKVFGIGKTPKSVDGIILIDEFDRHLHPRLQTSLVNKLSNEFPNIQFILTTHNPMAILDRKPDEITVIYEEDGIVKTKKDIGTKHIDVGTALLKYFGVDSLVGESMQRDIGRFTERKL